MPSNLDIDDDLLEQARLLGGHRSKKATVNEALKEYINKRKQQDVLNLFGSIDYYDDYLPKRFRKKST